MSEEIKEVIAKLSRNIPSDIRHDFDDLLDYITNLQKENDLLKEELQTTQEKWDKDKQWVECRTKEWLDYKTRCEKGIVFINIFQDEKSLTLNYNDLRHLRGILKGNEFDLRILQDKLDEIKGKSDE